MLEHRQLRRLLLGTRFLHARGLSGTLHLLDIASCAGNSSVLRHCRLHRGLLGARTSPATPGTPPCSDIASYARDSSVLGHRQLRRELIRARTSPAKLRTPLVVGSCYVSSVCYQAAPCCSDQGADLGQYVWGLDTRMSDDVGKLSSVDCCF